MSGRILVAAADAPGLSLAARKGHELATALGVAVEAVALSSPSGPVLPRAGSPEELLGAVQGHAERLLVYDVPADESPDGRRLADALVAACEGAAPAAVLMADAPATREAAARVAQRLDGPCVTMCESAEPAAGGGLRVTRAIYTGVALGTLTLEGGPPVCVLAPGASNEQQADGSSVEIVDRGPAPGATRVRMVSEEPVAAGVDLAGARVVVSVGRGFTKAEDIRLVDGLLAALGAELGCSRPIAEDFKWLPKERQVGLTGSSVSADLYLAIGISGQVQHLAGIKGARIVVAVNNDARSPIIKHADYSIVDDLYKVVPLLTDALAAAK